MMMMIAMLTLMMIMMMEEDPRRMHVIMGGDAWCMIIMTLPMTSTMRTRD